MLTPLNAEFLSNDFIVSWIPPVILLSFRFYCIATVLGECASLISYISIWGYVRIFWSYLPGGLVVLKSLNRFLATIRAACKFIYFGVIALSISELSIEFIDVLETFLPEFLLGPKTLSALYLLDSPVNPAHALS